MGFFDTVLDLFTPVVYADDNQAADELQSGSGKAYGEAHETPDSKPNADAQKGTEQSSADLTGTPKETDSSDKPFQGKTDDEEEGGDEEEASEDAGGDDEEEEEEDEPVDPMPRLLQECERTKECRHAKSEYDSCVARVTRAQEDESHKGHKEDCVEEFFHLTHCTMDCAAPKLFRMLA